MISAQRGVHATGVARYWQRPALQATMLLVPTLGILLAIMVYPLVKGFIMSLQDVQAGMPTAPGLSLSQYAHVLVDPFLQQIAWNTVFFTVITVTTELVLGTLGGFLLHRRSRISWLLSAAFIVPWATPTVVAATMWSWIFNPTFGSVNSLLLELHLIHAPVAWLATPGYALFSVIVMTVWKSTPLVAILVLAGMQHIPGDVMEAARVDSAGPLKRLWFVILPYLRVPLLAAALLQSIAGFQVFTQIFIMTSGGPANSSNVASVYAYQQMFSDLNMSYASAISFLIAVATLLLAVIYAGLLSSREGEIT